MSIAELIEEYWPIVIAVSGAIGFLLKWGIDLARVKVDEQKTKVADDKVDLERNRDVMAFAKQQQEMMLATIEPLSKRIASLEQDSSTKQERIMALEQQVFELTRTLRTKDLEIESLNRKYMDQVEISNQQEVKIQEQAKRISELESELKILKEQKHARSTK